MIERILPASVACVAVRGDDPDAWLYPEEMAALGPAVDSRLREFTTARHCARLALRRLGAPETPILRGDKREPLWPDGVVGSITHCTGYRAAVVARPAEFSAIGIDAEPHDSLPRGVAGKVLDEAERAWLAAAPTGIHWDRLMFCAKESVYKAWFPMTGRWLGFEDATLTVEPNAGTFRADLRIVSRGLAAFCGRFLVADGLVLTAIVVPA